MTEKLKISAIWGGLVGVVVGALLSGSVQMMVARYAAFKESQVMAVALRAEIEALRHVVAYHDWDTYIRGKIDRLQEPTRLQQIEPQDVVAIPIHGEYLIVFNAMVPKIGGLPPDVASRVVKSYTLTKSLIDQIKTLWEIHQAVLAGKKNLPLGRQRLLEITKSLHKMLQDAEREGEATVPELRKYSSRKWLMIIP